MTVPADHSPPPDEGLPRERTALAWSRTVLVANGLWLPLLALQVHRQLWVLAAASAVAAGGSLLAVATGAPGGITTVDYRVRNNYLDHQGRWGETRQSSGSDLIAYPNPPEGD